MTHTPEVADICETMILMAACEDVGSHRWMIHLLSAMIEYSEGRELKEVADPLIDAIEKIAPILATPGMRHFPIHPIKPVKTGKEYENIVYLHAKNTTL